MSGEDDLKSCEERLDPEWKKVDFSTFLLSLGTSALYQLGQGGQEGGGPAMNLPLARHVIDIMVMLQEKTRGNLSDDESKLIDTLLFDLRLKFVEACRGASVSAQQT